MTCTYEEARTICNQRNLEDNYDDIVREFAELVELGWKPFDIPFDPENHKHAVIAAYVLGVRRRWSWHKPQEEA